MCNYIAGFFLENLDICLYISLISFSSTDSEAVDEQKKGLSIDFKITILYSIIIM